jgi:hypothetical protein
MEEVEVLKKMIAPIAPTLTAVRQKNSQIKIKARKILIPHNKKIVFHQKEETLHF